MSRSGSRIWFSTAQYFSLRSGMGTGWIVLSVDLAILVFKDSVFDCGETEEGAFYAAS